MHWKKNLFVFLLACCLLTVLAGSSHAISTSAVTLNFMCPCGTCDEALSTCECPESDGFRSQIAGMIGRGYSEEQIVENFKGRFGPDVLTANAAMAPGAGGWSMDRKTIGFLFLAASFSLIAFSLGRYMKPLSASGRRRASSGHKPVRRPAGGKGKPKGRHRDDEAEGYLEDHEI